MFVYLCFSYYASTSLGRIIYQAFGSGRDVRNIRGRLGIHIWNVCLFLFFVLLFFGLFHSVSRSESALFVFDPTCTISSLSPASPVLVLHFGFPLDHVFRVALRFAHRRGHFPWFLYVRSSE